MKKIFRKLCLLLGCLLIFSTVAEVAVPMQSMAKKSTYTARYKKLEKKCRKLFKYDGSQSEMTRDANEEYVLWDKELNYVYKKAMKKASKSQKNTLKSSERKWIKKRDRVAKEESKDWEGGSGYPMIYSGSLTQSTKKRIKWIIKNYL